MDGQFQCIGVFSGNMESSKNIISKNPKKTGSGDEI